MAWRKGWARAAVCLLLQAALLLPLAAELLRLPSDRLCACGMTARSCSCSLADKRCGSAGGRFACSLRSPHGSEGAEPSGKVGPPDRFPPALRQNLRIRLVSAGRVADIAYPLLSSSSHPPEPPPPRDVSSPFA